MPVNKNEKNYYRILQKDFDGRSTFSKVVLLQSSTRPSLAIYPNPAKDKLYIDGLTGYRTAEIADVNGKIIQKQNVIPGLQYINIRRISSGVYMVILTGDKNIQSVKFIKN